MDSIKINVLGTEKEYEKGTTLEVISKDFKDKFKYPILSGSINNKTVTLDTKITRKCTVNFFDISSSNGNLVYQRGLCYIFSKAVRDVLNCDTRIMHTIDNGLYCEILTNNPISEVTTEKIKLRMKELNDKKIPITKIMVSRIDAIDYYEKINQQDKADSLRYISNSTISLYKLDDMLDFFYGVLPINTDVIDNYNLKYLKDNKVILLFPHIHMLDKALKYEKNEMKLNTIEENDKQLTNQNINTSADLNKIISTGKYGDIIRISELLQNNNMLTIADTISKNKNLKLILIAGPSSSGKTTSARKMSLLLRSKGLNPVPISTDDFFIDVKKRELNSDGEPEKEKITVIDTNQFNNKVLDLLNGKEVYLPRFNFVEGKQELNSKPTKLEDNSVLIVEGIHAFNEELTEMIPDKNKFKIFICPLTPLNIDNHNLFSQEDNRLLRRIIRDNSTRGCSASTTLSMWKSVRKAEEQNIFPFVSDADAIINSSLSYELGVLKTYAEPLLFSVSEDDPNYDEAIRLINMFRVILGIPSENVPQDSIIREFIGGSCFKD